MTSPLRASFVLVALLAGCAPKTDDTAGDNGGANGGDTAGDTSADTCMTDICTTYGAAVPQVASDITDAAAADPEFAPFFASLVAEGPTAVDAFKVSLANFISDAYGCSTGAYTGPTMQVAHAGMNITQAQYDAFIGLIAGVLADDGVASDDINYCFAPPLTDPSFAATIVGM